VSDILRSRSRTVALCLLGIAFNTAFFGPALRMTATGYSDFMSIYSGARLAFTGGMYNLDRNLQVQQQTAGWENIHRLFLRPPFDALLVWPLGQLPFRQAAIVWEIMIVLTVSLFCYLWPCNRKIAALACCWSMPLFDVFAEGQDIAILMLLVVLAMREMKRGRDITAALLFSLCSIKVHLFLLLPILILRQKLWRFAVGILLGGSVLFAVSFSSGGRNWPKNYFALLSDPISNPWPDVMPSIHGLTAGLPYSMLWQALGIAVVVLLAWIACKRGGFEYGLAAILVGGILVAPHAYPQDCALVLPALLITLALTTADWHRYLHIFLFSPFFEICTFFNQTWIAATALIAYLAWMAFARTAMAQSKI
jgi:hypothetical protein